MKRINSITTLTLLGVLVLATCASSASAAAEWTMDISAVMADPPVTADLTYGVSDSATDGFDEGVDANAPPADPSGFDAYFNEPEVGEGKLKVNIKSVGTPKTWTLMAVAPQSKTVNVSWTSGDILSNVEMQIQELDLTTGEPTGSVIDMKTQGLITITGGAYAATTKGYRITATTGAAPTLTWTTEPPASVTQGNNVTFDVSFSEAADYYIRIENSTGSVVWRSPTSGTGHAANPTAKTWTTTADTPTGDYTIIVNINGADNSDTKTITVGAATNQPPTAVIASPTASGTYHKGTEVSFLSTGSKDPDGTIEAYTWDFGDGNTSTSANTTHIYATADTYTVTLTVTDDDGATNSTTVTINVLPAGAVVVTLYEGWNLIAVPVNDTSANTAAELASKITGCKEIVMWDAAGDKYVTRTKIDDDWTGTDFAITGGMGIFVNVEGATTVGFTGDAWS